MLPLMHCGGGCTTLSTSGGQLKQYAAVMPSCRMGRTKGGGSHFKPGWGVGAVTAAVEVTGRLRGDSVAKRKETAVAGRAKIKVAWRGMAGAAGGGG